MRFVDECEIEVQAGKGGDGCAAFRREKFVPFGGPAGGDGGKGGDVVFIADPGLNTLIEFKHTRVLRAEKGAPGQGKDRYGRAGRDYEVRVPLGTIVYDRESGEKLFEFTVIGQREVVAVGGRGGRGNKHFATPVDRAPRRRELGQPGEQRLLRLELKVMADVGLLGYPNVGKSTFIRAVSRARPKVADYPFTTLVPHLGVVQVGDFAHGLGQSFVVADIPGLIPGASEGAGLGTRFLRHLDRTRVLLHLVTLDSDPTRSPLEDYRTLRRELKSHNPELARHSEVVAMTKADLPDVRAAYPEWRERFAAEGVDLHLISSATHEGLTDLLRTLAVHVQAGAL